MMPSPHRTTRRRARPVRALAVALVLAAAGLAGGGIHDAPNRAADALAVLLAQNARAHSDSCPDGQHATQINDVCVPAEALGFADWCLNNNGSFVAGGSETFGLCDSDAASCASFREVHGRVVVGQNVLQRLRCERNGLYSDGTCALSAANPHSYDPETHGCGECPAGAPEIDGACAGPCPAGQTRVGGGECQEPCPNDAARVGGLCPGAELAEFVGGFNQPADPNPSGTPRPGRVIQQSNGQFQVQWFAPKNLGDGRILGYEIWSQWGPIQSLRYLGDNSSALFEADPAVTCDGFTGYYRWSNKRNLGPGQTSSIFNRAENGWCTRWRICAKHSEDDCATVPNSSTTTPTAEIDPTEWVYTDPVLSRPRSTPPYRVVHGDKFFSNAHLEGADFCVRTGRNMPQNALNRTFGIQIFQNRASAGPDYFNHCILDGNEDHRHAELCAPYPSIWSNCQPTSANCQDRDAVCGIGRANGSEIASACGANSDYDPLQRGCACKGRTTPVAGEYSGSPAAAVSPSACACEVARADSSCNCSGVNSVYDPETHACIDKPPVPGRELTFTPNANLTPDSVVAIKLRLTGQGNSPGGAPATGATYKIFYNNAEDPVVGCSGAMAVVNNGLEAICSTKLPAGRAVLWGEYILNSNQHNRSSGRTSAEIEVGEDNQRDCETVNPLINPVGGSYSVINGDPVCFFPSAHFHDSSGILSCSFMDAESCRHVWADMRQNNCVARGLIFARGDYFNRDFSCVCPGTGAAPDDDFQCLTQADEDLLEILAPPTADLPPIADLYEHYFPAADRLSKCQGLAGNQIVVEVRDPAAADPGADVAFVCRTQGDDDICYQRNDDETGLDQLRTANGRHTFDANYTKPKCADLHPPCLNSSGDPDNSKNPFADDCDGTPQPTVAQIYEHYFPAADPVAKCQAVSAANDRAILVRGPDPGGGFPIELARICRDQAQGMDLCHLRNDGGSGLTGLTTANQYTFTANDTPSPLCTASHPPCLDASGELDNNRNPFSENCTGEPTSPMVDPAALVAALDAGADPDLTADGAPLLIAAAVQGNAEAVSILITAGANPNVADSAKRKLSHRVIDLGSDASYGWSKALRVLAHFADALDAPTARDFTWGTDFNIAFNEIENLHSYHEISGLNITESDRANMRRIARILRGRGTSCGFGDSQDNSAVCAIEQAACPGGDDSWTCRGCAAAPNLNSAGDACVAACPTGQVPVERAAPGDLQCGCADGEPVGKWGDCNDPRLTDEASCTTVDPMVNPLGGTWPASSQCVFSDQHFSMGGQNVSARCSTAQTNSTSCSSIYAKLRELACVERGLLYARGSSRFLVLDHCICPDTGEEGSCYSEPDVPDAPVATVSPNNLVEVVWVRPDLNQSTLSGYAVHRQTGSGSAFVSVAFSAVTAAVVTLSETVSEADAGRNLRYRVQTQSEFGLGSLSAQSDPAVQARACLSGEGRFSQPDGGYVCLPTARHPAAQNCLDAGWEVSRFYTSGGYGECGIPLRDEGEDADWERCYILWAGSAPPSWAVGDCDAIFPGYDFPQKPAEAARYVFNCPPGFAPDQSYESGTGSERQGCVDENSPLLIEALEGPVSGAPLTLLAHLISLGADPDAVNSGEVPALLLAGAAGHSAAVSLLISLGADPDARDPNNENRTLPHLAGRDWFASSATRWETALEVLRSFALAVEAAGGSFDWNALAGGLPPLDGLKASFDFASTAAERLLISEMAGLIRERGGRCASQADAHRVCRAEGKSPEQLLAEQVSRLVPNLATVAMLVTQVLDVSGADDDGVSYLLLAGVAAHPEVVSILVAAGANPNARHPGRFDHNLAHLQTRNQASAHPWERRLRVLEHFDNALTDLGASFGGWDGLNRDAVSGGGAGGVRPRDYLAAPYATATAEADRHAILRMAALLHVRDGRCVLSENAQSDTCRTPDALLLEQVRRAEPNVTLAALHAERADVDAVAEGLPLLALAATLGHAGVVSVLVFAGADAGALASDGRNVAHLMAQNEAGSWPVSRDVLLAFGEAVSGANASFDWNVSSGGLNALELLGEEFNAVSLTATPAEVEAIQAMANYFNRRGLSCQYIQSAICDLSDAPDAPGNFQLNLTGPVTTVVTLSWLAAEENGSEVTAYYLWRSEPVALPPESTACPETIYGSYLDDPPEFRLEGTARAFGEDLGSAGYGFCYEYAIAALNADGEGPRALARRLVQTVPAAAGTPRVTTSFSGVPRVSWDALTDQATEIRGARIVAYQLAREDNMGLANNWGRRREGLAPANPLSTVFADNAATVVQYAYRYQVQARGLTGLWGPWGPWSEGVMPQTLAAGCGPGERDDGTGSGCQRVGSLCRPAPENKRWLQDLRPGREEFVQCRCETNEDGLDGNESYCAPRGLPAPLPGVNENPQHPLTVFASCKDAGYAPLANDDYLATPPRNDNPSQGVSDSRYLYCGIHTEELIGGVSQGVRDRCVVAVQTHQRELIAKRDDGYFNFLHPEAGDALVTLRFCHELFAGLRGGPELTGSFPAESAGVLHEAHNPYRHGSCGPGEMLSRQHNRCVRDCFSGVYTDLGQGSVSGLVLTPGSDVQSDSCACPAEEFLDGGVCASSCGVGRVAVTDLTLAANEPDWTPLSCVDRPNIGDWEAECGSIETDDAEVVFVGSYRENNLAVLCPLNRDLYNRERQVLYNSRFCWLSAEPNFHLNNPPSSEPLHIPPCWELTAAGQPVDPPGDPNDLPGSYRNSTALAEYGQCLTRPSAAFGKLVEQNDGNCGCQNSAAYAQLGSYCIHRTDPAPKEAVVCDGVFGGTIDDEVVCGGIDWNDTFCLVGSPDAFPCQGLFDHVRDCNVLGRPAVDPWVCGPRCVLGHAAGARCVFGAREFLLDQNGSLELRAAALTAAAEYDPALHTVTLLQTATRPVFSVVSGEFEVSQDGVVRRTPGNLGQSSLAVVQVTHPRKAQVYFRLTVEVAWVRAPAYNGIVLDLDSPSQQEKNLPQDRLSGFGHPGGLTDPGTAGFGYTYEGLYRSDRPRNPPPGTIEVERDGILRLNQPEQITTPGSYEIRLTFEHPDMKGDLTLNIPLRVTN